MRCGAGSVSYDAVQLGAVLCGARKVRARHVALFWITNPDGLYNVANTQWVLTTVCEIGEQMLLIHVSKGIRGPPGTCTGKQQQEAKQETVNRTDNEEYNHVRIKYNNTSNEYHIMNDIIMII